MSAPRDIAIEISSRLVLDLSDDQIERIAQIIQRVVSRPAAPASADVAAIMRLAELASDARLLAWQTDRGAKTYMVNKAWANYDAKTAAFASALTAALAEGERLNKWADGFDAATMKERQLADVRIKELTQQLSEARAALKPFAQVASGINANLSDFMSLHGFQRVHMTLTVGDLRRAAQATASGDAP